MTDMDAAYRKDYADKERLRDLRMTLLDFLECPPARCSPRIEDALDKAVVLLETAEAHIVAVWD